MASLLMVAFQDNLYYATEYVPFVRLCMCARAYEYVCACARARVYVLCMCGCTCVCVRKVICKVSNSSLLLIAIQDSEVVVD